MTAFEEVKVALLLIMEVVEVMEAGPNFEVCGLFCVDEWLPISVLKTIHGDKLLPGVFLFLVVFFVTLSKVILPSLGDWILDDRARVTSFPKSLRILG